MNNPPTLTAAAIWARYQQDFILKGIDLAIEPKAFTAILGPNGCGKSTLLRALAGLHRLDKGQVRLGETDCRTIRGKALARRVSILAQGAVPPDGTSVEDLVRQGRYPHRGLFSMWSVADQTAVETALQQTGMQTLRDAPLDTLSGGQRQRAWIAMTLAQEAQIVLLDEPTTFLDPAHQVEVLGLARQMVRSGKTVVAVLHDINLAASFADTLVFMKSGEIQASGTPRDVVTSEMMQHIFGLAAKIVTDPDSGAPVCLPRISSLCDA